MASQERSCSRVLVFVTIRRTAVLIYLFSTRSRHYMVNKEGQKMHEETKRSQVIKNLTSVRVFSSSLEPGRGLGVQWLMFSGFFTLILGWLVS